MLFGFGFGGVGPVAIDFFAVDDAVGFEANVVGLVAL